MSSQNAGYPDTNERAYLLSLACNRLQRDIRLLDCGNVGLDLVVRPAVGGDILPTGIIQESFVVEHVGRLGEEALDGTRTLEEEYSVAARPRGRNVL